MSLTVTTVRQVISRSVCLFYFPQDFRKILLHLCSIKVGNLTLLFFN